jgi:DNA-binding MarR family transcriptional regulator
MPFTGTFDILNFTDVLKLLGGKQLTGRLHVRSRSIGANLYLEEGLLVGGDVGEHQTTSSTEVRSRIEEICFELLEAERGTFEFLPDTPIAAQYPVSLQIESVLIQARKRLEEWREIQAVIPSLDVHPRIVNDLNRDEVTLSRERWRLMTAIDGRRSIRAIARSLGGSDYDVCRMIKSLVDEGMVAVDAPQRAVVNRRTPTVFVDESAEQAEAELEAKAPQPVTNGHNGHAPPEHAAAPEAPAAPATPETAAATQPAEDLGATEAVPPAPNGQAATPAAETPRAEAPPTAEAPTVEAPAPIEAPSAEAPPAEAPPTAESQATPAESPAPASPESQPPAAVPRDQPGPIPVIRPDPLPTPPAPADADRQQPGRKARIRRRSRPVAQTDPAPQPDP